MRPHSSTATLRKHLIHITGKRYYEGRLHGHIVYSDYERRGRDTSTIHFFLSKGLNTYAREILIETKALAARVVRYKHLYRTRSATATRGHYKFAQTAHIGSTRIR